MPRVVVSMLAVVLLCGCILDSEAATDGTVRSVDLRLLREDGLVLFSSDPSEDGALLREFGHLGAVEPNGTIRANWSDWPKVLAPVAMRLARADGFVRERVVLPVIPGEETTIARRASLPLAGSMAWEDAAEVFGPPVHNVTVLLSGLFPVRLAVTDADAVGYRFLTSPEGNWSVPRAVGLKVRTAVEEGVLVLSLESDEVFGVFAGCRGVGGADLPSGVYVRVRQTPDAIVASRVPSGLDWALSGRTVIVEANVSKE